jgi:hypothetical protein
MTTVARSAINLDGNDRPFRLNPASLSEVRPGRPHENPRCKVGRKWPGRSDERGLGQQCFRLSRDDVVRGTKNSYGAWVSGPAPTIGLAHRSGMELYLNRRDSA